jgi:mannose-6-phosphate isomerase-like protein (cupin superfamily)
MPVLRSGKGKAPGWCELEDFEFIELKRGETRKLSREGKKEEIIVCSGFVEAASGDVACFLAEGGKMDLNSERAAPYCLTARSEQALVFRAMGRWESINGSGLFFAQRGTPPTFDTPHEYEKTTGFDNHYHDCDEYWIFFEGRCRAASEGKIYEVGAGDCVATGMGWHHDVVSVESEGPAKAIWFEGTLEGEKRFGHLWEPKHGKAEPKRERV